MSDDLKLRVMRLEAMLDDLGCPKCKQLSKRLEDGYEHYKEVVMRLSNENARLRAQLSSCGKESSGSSAGFMRYSEENEGEI